MGKDKIDEIWKDEIVRERKRAGVEKKRGNEENKREEYE